ncbi:MAG: hypothetical protein IJD16_05215 [Desulfovibrio sp.]|nr:hypothetical protein [Desulfovibrio sp.]
METSAVAGGMEAIKRIVQDPSVQAATGMVSAKHVLSDFEKIFFDKTLQTKCAESPEIFSNQGISAMSVQEMSYWSIELHNSGCLKS